MNQTIFITGASSGLGKAAAKLFQENGWKVAATMRSPEKETELDKLENVKLYELDVTNAAQIKETSNRAIKDFGHIDVVLNNAGYGLVGIFEIITDEQLVRQIDTNLLGVMRTTQAFLPHFREHQAGLLINVTSIGGLVAFPLNSAYHATKWALEGWSESLWFELQNIGVGIKTVAPGGIKTDFAGRSLDVAANPEVTEYDATVKNTMAFFMDPQRAENYSTAEQIAAVIYEAATDGKKQLRYLAGEDAHELYRQRLAAGDQNFMQAMSEHINNAAAAAGKQ